ncbi:transcription initiation factor IIB 2 [Halobellus salinus]|uniref:Transcription initiation factor IIB n=1 Tax=Halobellus salinus TaxID=931585 RepID=A0A830ERX3_9EURY|nr:TFIIB-type zinc ribbon-containing protein [Halobellus salinus]GGJ04143.1 transcription initiation factor IIB 2 [Halobellus salinus]SMP08377.1 transcription initiation factor TFIIB [Halobellus salinus]
MDHQTHETTDPTEESQTERSEKHRCPECGETVRMKNDTAEQVCTACGLVVDEQRIDHGPEWRAFDAAEKAAKSRVGAPTTHLMHDKGLSTNIGWQNQSTYQSSVSPRKRQRLQRLRTWNKRFRTRDSKERNLKQALGEIDRMASALGVHKPTRETASVMYRRALEDDLLPGRSIEGVATAVLYAATRMDGVARTIDEIAAVSRVDALEIKRTYRYVVRELYLQIPPTDPIEYVGRIASKLDCSDDTTRQARQLIEAATARGVHSGKHPVGIAASAVYAAGKLCDETITQDEVSEVADISNVTIRNRYREVLAAYEDDHSG